MTEKCTKCGERLRVIRSGDGTIDFVRSDLIVVHKRDFYCWDCYWEPKGSLGSREGVIQRRGE